MTKAKDSTETAAPKKAAVKKTATKAPTPTKVPAPAKTSTPAKVSAPPPAKKKAPAKKTATPTPAADQLTTVKAKIDIGFGNKLYIRGSEGGLSWEKGALMTCLPTGDTWIIVFENLPGPVAAKFVLNDTVWSAGEDFAITPGQENLFTPLF